MNPEIDHILARYFSGEATATDQAALDEWLAASEANERTFEQMTLLFEKTAPAAAPQQPDTAKALQRFKEYIKIQDTGYRIQDAEDKIQDIQDAGYKKQGSIRKNSYNSTRLYWPAAAVLAVAIALAVFYLRPAGDHAPALQVVAAAATETFTLPDSTVVTLAPHSRISYHKNYGAQERRLQLTGKATFDVGAYGAGPFTVEAGGLIIQDIGTVFTVDAYAGNDKINIAVATGSVVFTSTGDSRATELHAGETGVYDKLSGRVETTLQETDPPLVFDAATLQEVAALLSQRYGVAIRLSDAALAQRRISVRFDDEDLHTILDIIAETLSLKVTFNNDTYTLSVR